MGPSCATTAAPPLLPQQQRDVPRSSSPPRPRRRLRDPPSSVLLPLPPSPPSRVSNNHDRSLKLSSAATALLLFRVFVAFWAIAVAAPLRAFASSSSSSSSVSMQSPLGPPSDEMLTESLRFEQFNDGKVLALFNFSRSFAGRSVDAFQESHYSLFPKTLGETLQTFGVVEMHLTFTQGRWNHEHWGYSPIAAAPGVQLWSWFNASDIDTKWKSLTNALAGSFCASLNFIDQSLTAEPRISLSPEGHFPSQNRSFSTDSPSGFQLRAGSLPREITCTENLTPWTKLLPCRTHAGIATLFNAYKLYDTDFHSMSVHVVPKCADPSCTKRELSLVQTLAVVFDPIRMSASRTDDWSLDFLFNRQLTGACPLAQKTFVEVVVPSSEGLSIQPTPARVGQTTNGRYRAEFDLPLGEAMNIAIQRTNPYPSNVIDRSISPIRVHRYLTGYGRERGGIAVNIYNYGPDPVRVAYLESIPWFLRIYLHTLTVDSKPLLAASSTDRPGSPPLNESAVSVLGMEYQPAIDRVRPTVMEMTMRIPALSLTSLAFDFDRAFIKYTEHPPDANRGFDIGPGLLTVLDAGATSVAAFAGYQHHHPRIWTETLLIALPTPDFSMPYNVITMTCTIMALFFGSFFNLLSREFVAVEVAADGDKAPGAKGWRGWLAARFSRRTTTKKKQE
ncbi:Gpi16 subunit, GPI transamidase component-domain-containing protein [Zopfochytrium polystomum]|nr:Gpi16 subunit, GPI transamidase component-domain-containing protein [Zopfochytrium polystomum]